MKQYNVYAYEDGKWYLVRSFDVQQTATEYAKEFERKYNLSAVVEVEDGGKH